MNGKVRGLHDLPMIRCLLVALACLAIALPCARPAAAQPAPEGPPVVGVITATEQPVYTQQSYVGRIVSPQIVQVLARVTGYLESQNFTDGAAVTKGQLLYVIEQPPYQAAVTQAQAALAQAQAESVNAQLTYRRATALLRTPAGQQSTVDSAQAAALTSTAQIDNAEAALQIAQINLGYTEIRAPLNGQIGATAVNTGNVVGPTSGPLATIVAQDPMYVEFALPVVDALADRGNLAGLDLLVQLPDGTIYGQTGKIDFVNNQVTANTDTLTLRGTIANPAAANGARTLTDGEFITAILRAKTPQQQILIPRQAVITDQLGDYVLLLGPGNTVIRRAVVQGPATNAAVQIISGLTPGDRVIVDGIQSIHPGITVTPRPAS
jgi:membrane fusion protein (multidrug efflux system)